MAQDNDSTLIALWQKRDQLDEAQWAQLYHLMTQVIKGGRYPQLASLPDSIEDYIQEFIYYKAFETARREEMGGGQLYYENALRTYFRRFLIDLLRKANRENTVPLPPEDSNQDVPLEDDNQDVPLEDSNQDVPLEDDTQEATKELWQKEVAKSAKDFLQDSENWVRLYLGLHTCAEPRLALSKLAARYQIASYHYKARQLGITRHKNDSLQDYEKTLLGAWLKSLGLSLQQDKAATIENAFKILCDEALSIIETELSD